jgi:hypothetical protein
MRAAHRARDNSMNYARPGLSVATASPWSGECTLPCDINDLEAKAASGDPKFRSDLSFEFWILGVCIRNSGTRIGDHTPGYLDPAGLLHLGENGCRRKTEFGLAGRSPRAPGWSPGFPADARPVIPQHLGSGRHGFEPGGNKTAIPIFR